MLRVAENTFNIDIMQYVTSDTETNSYLKSNLTTAKNGLQDNDFLLKSKFPSDLTLVTDYNKLVVDGIVKVLF